MNNFPQDTRNQYKSIQRDSMNFRTTLPAVSNNAFGDPYNIPVFDPKMFSNPQPFETGPRNMHNDRLFESAQLYRKFDDFAGSTNNQNFNQGYTYNEPQPGFKISTHSKEDKLDRKRSLDENRNFDRMFLTQRDYNAETQDRVIGFNIVPKDTRFDNTRKSSEGQIEMRSNRYMGMPGNNI